jgi:carbamoyl-phosphate synthase large subunit
MNFNNSYKILIEASGSLVSSFLIQSIKESGNIAIASDIDSINHSLCLANSFILMPKITQKDYWQQIENILIKNNIDIVIPSLDETLLQWAKRIDYFKNKNIHIIISNHSTIEICLDKYKTYLFCQENGILTPQTSLNNEFELAKPRFGRGGSGIYLNKKDLNLTNYIYQSYIKGTEYTVDCFFDKDHNPIYIIPRIRLDVKDGKSTKGKTIKHLQIQQIVKQISTKLNFIGCINFQFIENKEGIFLIEINPRVAGGMALGFKASENWINLIIQNLIHQQPIKPKQIKYNLVMARYYKECFFEDSRV